MALSWRATTCPVKVLPHVRPIFDLGRRADEHAETARARERARRRRSKTGACQSQWCRRRRHDHRPCKDRARRLDRTAASSWSLASKPSSFLQGHQRRSCCACFCRFRRARSIRASLPDRSRRWHRAHAAQFVDALLKRACADGSAGPARIGLRHEPKNQRLITGSGPNRGMSTTIRTSSGHGGSAPLRAASGFGDRESAVYSGKSSASF